MRNSLLWARLSAAIAIVALVLAVTAVSFSSQGIASATSWFQLTQGVGGVALGWLFTSQGMDAALSRAAEEARAAGVLQKGAAGLEDRLALLEFEVKGSRELAQRLLNDPLIGTKVEELMREMEE